MTFVVSEAYAPRVTAFLDLHQGPEDWRLKVYSVRVDDRPLDEPAFARAFVPAERSLPRPATTRDRPGVGFVICHQGRGVDYLVLAWWDRENELPLRVFVREPESVRWRPAQDGESICVWDLDIIAHERDAYIRHVLSKPESPALDAYLGATVLKTAVA